MEVDRAGRVVFAVTALAVATGLVIQFVVTARLDEGFFDTSLKRTLNVLNFFTIQSNMIVGGTTLALAAGWARPTTLFRTLRLIGVIAIALTFIVFHVALKELQDLTGGAAVADFLLHTASPILCVGGWLLFGPRGQTTKAVVWWSLSFLVVWGVFTLIRGHIVGYYPYPFIDPADSGYARVAANLTLIGGVFVAMAAGAHLLDKHLPNRSAD